MLSRITRGLGGSIAGQARSIISYNNLFVLIVVCASLLAFTPQAFDFESSVSLPLLFQARNAWVEPSAPDNVVVVSPFIVKDPDLPGHVRHFGRDRHAEIVDRLVSLGAEIIVVDLYFVLSSVQREHDDALADSFARTPGLVMIQKSEKLTVTVKDKNGKESTEVIGSTLRNSIRSFTATATLMAPPLVPADVPRVNRVPLFHHIFYDSRRHVCFAGPAREDADIQASSAEREVLSKRIVPTLTFSLLEQHLLNSMKASRVHVDWLKSNVTEAPSSRLSCNFMASLRDNYRDNALSDFPTFSDDQSQEYLEKWKAIVAEQHMREDGRESVLTLQLNFPGPPRTISTIDYKAVDRMFEQQSENIIRNATVFLGGSFKDADDQKEDGHLTAFTGGSRLMSGVEIKATAYHNLMSDTAVRVWDDWFTLFLIALDAFVVWFAATRMDMRWFVVATTTAILALVVLACYAFVAHRIWMPVAFTSCTSAVLVALSVVWRFRGSSRDRDRAIHYLNSFVSDPVVRQLDTGKNHVVHSAVCLVTDIRNFTAVGQTMEPGVLHMTNDAYFTHLFDCVAAEGVDVVKTYGDSMTAVWVSGSDDAIDRAVRAGVRILDSSSDNLASSWQGGMVTNIGLHCGELAVGFVGHDKQRTVEITGSTVYMASRLEQLNKVLGTRFLTTRAVSRRLRGWHTRQRGQSLLKGYEEPVDIVEICTDIEWEQEPVVEEGSINQNTKMLS